MGEIKLQFCYVCSDLVSCHSCNEFWLSGGGKQVFRELEQWNEARCRDHTFRLAADFGMRVRNTLPHFEQHRLREASE
jgi:hypothetical protein